MFTYTNFQKKVSLVLKVIVAIAAVLGTFLSALAGRNSFMGGTTVFMYFTIQSNILITLVSLVGILFLLRGKSGKVWYTLTFVATVAITLTGVVFCFVLAPTMGKAAWNVQNILTHVVTPVVSVLDFFVCGPSGKIRKKNAFLVIIPPILYLIYASVGYVKGWEFGPGINYPYFFLNWGSPMGAFGFGKEFPFMGCVWWILLLLVSLPVVGFFYLIIVDFLRLFRKKTREEKLEAELKEKEEELESKETESEVSEEV